MGSGGQTWGFLQDDRGVLYFAATGGIAVYDGTSWRLIDVDEQTVRSIARDSSGRIYVGGVANLGYLAPNQAGDLTFVSLRDRLPPNERVFTDVWRVFVTPQGIYFQTQFALFRWANDTMRVWKPADRFGRASYVDGRLIIPQTGVGLSEMVNDELRPLPGTAAFANEVYPVVLPYDSGRLLIGTRADGFFLYDGSTTRAFPTGVDDLIKKGTLYRGTLLPNGSIAVTTTAAGAAVIDHDGRRVQVIDETAGLPTVQAYYANTDRSGALWLTTAVGVSRIDVASPATFFDTRDGLRLSNASDIVRFEGRLMAATSNGVVVFHPATAGSPARFTAVAGVTNQCWRFLVTEAQPGRPSQLLVASSDGVFQIAGDRAIPVVLSVAGSYNAATLARFAGGPNRIWVGLFNGMTTLAWRNGKWVDEGRFGFTAQVRSLIPLPNGAVWGGT